MVLVVMGVSGAGKSTVGRAVAGALGWAFQDADDFHAPEAMAQMARGEPLTDAQRGPWLARLRAWVDATLGAGTDAVLAWSALTAAHRATVGVPRPGVRVVHLVGAEAVLRERLRSRRGHFVRDQILTSQIATLEPPGAALVVDVAGGVDHTVAAIVADLRAGASAS